MSATKPFQRQLASYKTFGRCLFLILQHGSDVDTTCATDVEFTFILRVEIEQDITLQCTFLKAESTIHARLFILRNEHFQRTVLQVLSLEHRHGSCYTQAIVGTQSRTFSLHPIAIHIGFNWVFCKIMYCIIVLLRHHVHVGLQDDPFAILHAWSSRLTNDDIADLVDKRLQSKFFAEVHQKFGHFFYMP